MKWLSILVFLVLYMNPYLMRAQVAVADFRLENANGKATSLSDYPLAKGFVIVFTSNHCPFARLYENRFNSIHADLKELGYQLILINPARADIFDDDTFMNMIRKSKQNSYSFPFLQDETQSVAKSFGATKTPEFYLVSRSKSNYYIMYKGAFDNNGLDPSKATKKYLYDALADVEAGRKVEIPLTKAIGCSIIWK